jgi:uncharacterized protein (DUF2384 family)
MSGGLTGSKVGWKATYQGVSKYWTRSALYGDSAESRRKVAVHQAKRLFRVPSPFLDAVLPEGMLLEQIPPSGKEMKAALKSQREEQQAKFDAEEAKREARRQYIAGLVEDVFKSAGVAYERIGNGIRFTGYESDGPVQIIVQATRYYRKEC